MMLHPIRILRSRYEQDRAVIVSRVVGIVASIFLFLLVVPGSAASKRCWPLNEVMSAHEKQGDEIVLIFSSWLRDGAYTILFQDPADGIITEVAVSPSGLACIFDVGDELMDSHDVLGQPLG